MKLSRSNVECPKDTHGKLIGGESDVKVREEARISKEKRRF